MMLQFRGAESAPGPLGVAIRNASVRFDGAAIFENLDLNLAAGLTTCLLGASGVGKSTLLRIIAGLQTGAEAIVEADDLAPLAGRIAYMAQQDLLLPWLHALDNVTLGARLRGSRDAAAENRARALLEALGLGDRLDAKPAELSGGMRQRVALARTLFENRPVVLMDEPFSALDAITRARLQVVAAEMLVDRTVLLVTHDPLEALRLGHRVHVMSGNPATIGAALTPAGPPPRPVDDPEVLRVQGELLKRLAA
jgi:putative hydroxymethylpyrimidine transport system ATP-binding protein